MKLKLTYVFTVIAAILLGFYLGPRLAQSPEPLLAFFGKSLSFSLGPADLDLYAMKLHLGLEMSINVLQVLLVAIAIFATPKLAEVIK